MYLETVIESKMS